MADYTMFHALGQGEQLDPNDPRRTQLAAPAFQPPIAPQSFAQQQPPQQLPPQQQQPPQQPYGAGVQSLGVPSQGQAVSRSASPFNPLAAQMGGLALGGNEAHHAARRKKKDHHAYHTVEAPVGSAMGFAAMPVQPEPVPGAQFTAAPTGPNSAYLPANPTNAGGFAPAPGAAAPIDPVAEPTVVPASGQQKVSPDDIPSVPLSRDTAQQHYLSNVYPTFERHVPPPAAISFIAFDQGNASPKYARLTMNNIPATAEGLHGTGLPLGLLLQPLAPLQAGELPIPVLDFGEAGPPRCRRCRAYINPFMVFRSGGNKFVCNLCTYPNETSAEYFCATSPQGVRLDRDQRPELCRGTVEFVVPKEYWTREPVGLRWLFVIDATQEAYNKGFLEAFCEGILGALYGGDADAAGEGGANGADGEPQRNIPANARVGFVTFDKEVQFYNVSASLEQAQMMVMPDIEDPFVPLNEGLFVDPYESRAVITSLLTRLPQMFSTIKNPEPALLSTLNAAISALEATGGKVVCSISTLPTWGPGRLFLRDDGKHIGGELDKKLYTTEHPGWKKAAERMVAAGIGADFFMAAPAGGFLDVATIGHVSATTGGEGFYYPNFVAGRDNARLSAEVRHAVTRETGYQAMVKVRCSNGLQVSAYLGNFVQHVFEGDLEMGTVDADKAIGLTFSYDGKLDAKLDAHFQSALLYTTAGGERRVRCSNVIASVSESGRESLKFVDQDAVCAIVAKEAAARLGHTAATLHEVRQGLTERAISVLAAYRRNFASQAHPPSQLIMPERLKEFSMLVLCMLKCRAFKGGSEATDRRVHELRMVRGMGAGELSAYLYPRMLALHNLQPEEGFPDAATGQLRLPPAMRATFARVEPGGVYLVDNGQQCLLWLERQTSPNLIADLFGEQHQSLQSLDPYASSLPVLPTHLSAQVRNILAFLRTLRGSKGLTVQLARQGLDGAEFEFARLLVEDRNNEAQSYVDWLVHLHKGVQLELGGGQKKREDYGDGSSFAGLRSSYW